MVRQFTQFILISIIITKVLYILVDLVIAYEIYSHYTETQIKKLQNIRQGILTLSEIFIYLLFVIIFNPLQKKVVIEINRFEQILLFTLGILALSHIEWDRIKSLHY